MKQKIRRSGVLFILAIGFSVLLTACGPKTVDVALGQYEMTVSPASVKAGEIVFSIHNDAELLVHEFVVVKSDLAAGSLTVGPDGIVDESQMAVVDEVEDMEPGASAELTVTLEPGHYILLCNIENHYGLGMRADFTVVP